MKLKLILLGSLSPLIGLLIFFLQLQVPFHGIKYLVAYFFFCHSFFPVNNTKRTAYTFL